MATLKGTWRFHDVLTVPDPYMNSSATVNFTFSFTEIVPTEDSIAKAEAYYAEFQERIEGGYEPSQEEWAAVEAEIISILLEGAETVRRNAVGSGMGMDGGGSLFYDYRIDGGESTYMYFYGGSEGWKKLVNIPEPPQTITFTSEQEVSSEFFEWFTTNAVEQKQISGVWKFKDVLSVDEDIEQNLSFTVESTEYGTLNFDKISVINIESVGEKEVQFRLIFPDVGEGVPRAYIVYNNGWRIGYFTTAIQTIDYGTQPQYVSIDFYNWFTANAVRTDIIQFNFTQNGTTTLATAGKYCDRNIDVNVSVPTHEGELATEKEKIALVLARTIVEYTDDTTTELGWYAFRYCQQMTKADFAKLTVIKSGAFQNCKALAALMLRSNTMVTLGNTDAFGNSLIASGAGYVYVPDDLVDSYKTATNWTAYADKIKPISELEA